MRWDLTLTAQLLHQYASLKVAAPGSRPTIADQHELPPTAWYGGTSYWDQHPVLTGSFCSSHANSKLCVRKNYQFDSKPLQIMLRYDAVDLADDRFKKDSSQWGGKPRSHWCLPNPTWGAGRALVNMHCARRRQPDDLHSSNTEECSRAFYLLDSASLQVLFEHKKFDRSFTIGNRPIPD